MEDLEYNRLYRRFTNSLVMMSCGALLVGFALGLMAGRMTGDLAFCLDGLQSAISQIDSLRKAR